MMGVAGSEQGSSSSAGRTDRFRLVVVVGEFRFEGEGAHDEVMTAYDRVRAELEERFGDVPEATLDQDAVDEESKAAATPLPVFLKTRDLGTNALKATAILVWAERFEGRGVLSPSEVEDYWKRTPYKLPGNLARDLGKAATQGWVEQKRHGEYASTGFGVEEIDRLRFE